MSNRPQSPTPRAGGGRAVDPSNGTRSEPRPRKGIGDADAQPPPPEPIPLSSIDRPEPPIEAGFPDSCAPIRDFVRAGAESLQVPIDVLALGVLPVALVAIAGAAEIAVSSDYSEPSSLWGLILAPSGERKSATLRLLTDPIAEWERDEASRLAPELARWTELRKIDEARLANLRKRAASGKGDAAARDEAAALAERLATEKAPTAPCLIVDDVTSEALARAMIDSGERALVASAEADALDIIGGRYTEGRMTAGNFLKGHAGDRIRVRRVNRPAEFLERPCLSMLLLVQPESVEGMYANRQARGRGLLARFLGAWPESRCGYRKIDPAPMPSEVREGYRRAVRALLDMPRSIDRGPATVRLSPGAASLLRAFRELHEPQLKPSGEYGDRRDWGSKLPGAVLRIALALAAWGWACKGSVGSVGDCGDIDESTMRAALEWVEYLSRMERIVSGVAGTDPDVSRARAVLRWIVRARVESFTERDALRGAEARNIQRAEDLAEPLRLLVDHRYIWAAPSPEASSKGGRPPSARYIVNPGWDRESGL